MESAFHVFSSQERRACCHSPQDGNPLPSRPPLAKPFGSVQASESAHPRLGNVHASGNLAASLQVPFPLEDAEVVADAVGRGDPELLAAFSQGPRTAMGAGGAGDVL